MKTYHLSSRYYLGSFMILFALVGFLPGGLNKLAVGVEGGTISQMGAPLTTPTPIPELNTFDTSATFTFKDFEQETQSIAYPGAAEIFFDLPNRWLIRGSGLSFLELHYRLDHPDFEKMITTEYFLPSPKAQVYINDYFIGSFIPIPGETQVKKIPIISEFLAYSLRNNPYNEYDVRIEYTANYDDYCEYFGVLTIFDHSFVQLKFTVLPPLLDLANYSDSIVQDSFIPETMFIVLPDEFSESDLNTAALLLQDISKKTLGNVQARLIPASELTRELLAKTSVVTIGPPSRNSFTNSLFELNLLAPTLVNGNTIEYRVPIADGDGLLQVIPNYLNDIYGIVVITGATDQAVDHGAKALINPTDDLAGKFFIVKEDTIIEELQPAPLAAEDMTFKSLGFRETAYYGTSTHFSGSSSQFGGTSTHKAYITFYLPRNWEIQDGVSLNLIYNHSSNLSKTNSSFTIILNNRLIGTAPIDPKILGDKEILIPIDPENLIPGSLNVIVFDMTPSAATECAPWNARAYWTTIRERSSLHIPYKEIGLDGNFPPIVHPFYFLAYDHSPLILNLPTEPSTNDLYAMAKMVQFLSDLSPQSLNISIKFNSGFDLSTLVDENVLMVGKPSENPTIGKLNEVLPQPFVSGEDTLLEKVGNISYQVPAGIDMGMVEALPSTWNPSKGITLVTGTTDKGYVWGIDLSSSDDYVYEFFGDVFFIYDKKITSFLSVIPIRDTLDQIIEEVTEQEVTLEPIEPTQTPGASPSAPDSYDSPTDQQDGAEQQIRKFAQYILAGILAVGLLIAILTLIRTARGGRRT